MADRAAGCERQCLRGAPLDRLRAARRRHRWRAGVDSKLPVNRMFGVKRLPHTVAIQGVICSSSRRYVGEWGAIAEKGRINLCPEP